MNRSTRFWVLLLDFLHKSKKEPHPVFDLRQSLPSPLAGRGWGWGLWGMSARLPKPKICCMGEVPTVRYKPKQN